MFDGSNFAPNFSENAITYVSPCCSKLSFTSIHLRRDRRRCSRSTLASHSHTVCEWLRGCAHYPSLRSTGGTVTTINCQTQAGLGNRLRFKVSVGFGSSAQTVISNLLYRCCCSVALQAAHLFVARNSIAAPRMPQQ